jgi:hypothetical protein
VSLIPFPAHSRSITPMLHYTWITLVQAQLQGTKFQSNREVGWVKDHQIWLLQGSKVRDLWQTRWHIHS